MAKAEYPVTIDGQNYEPGDEIPDLGSLICVEFEGNQRHYEGLISDVDKLPLYVGSGSSALLYDGAGTTNVYHFLNGKWYEL